MQFLQCPKLAWNVYNIPNMFTSTDPATKARMAEGKAVEAHARKLFPAVTLIDHSQSFDDIVDQSNDALSYSTIPICNAILSSNGFSDRLLTAETDILVPCDDEYLLYEVKASTRAKPEHIPDIAFQKYVAEKRGLRIRQCFLILLNGKYIRKGEINTRQLFKIGDVTEGVQQYGESSDINAQVENAFEVCNQAKCPETEIGVHCSSDCPLRNTCWREVNKIKHNIFDLYRMPGKKAFGWYKQGITGIEDIPEDYPLTKFQKIQSESEKTGEIHADRKEIKKFINQLTYPLYFLDFETFSSAIPLIDNSAPYSVVPFQYSLHIIDEDLSKEPQHHSWIWGTEGEPRSIMLEQLKSLLGNKGNIIAYNALFEQMVLKQAVDLYPKQEKWLNNILKRFEDLLQPFRNFHIYNPAQKGSCSLKAVLPALTGQDYSQLQIQDGEQASRAFMGILNGEVDDKQAILANLEIYCGQDTMAMIEILRKMKTLTTL